MLAAQRALDQRERRPRRRRHRSCGLLRDAAFEDVTAEVRTEVFTGPSALPVLTALAAAQASGAVTREQADGWPAEQRVRADTDRLFLAIPMFLASGTAPGRPRPDPHGV
ncbi:hypothetical protein ACL02R_27325 [Streptomyces sp. MS19]